MEPVLNLEVIDAFQKVFVAFVVLVIGVVGVVFLCKLFYDEDNEGPLDFSTNFGDESELSHLDLIGEDDEE